MKKFLVICLSVIMLAAFSFTDTVQAKVKMGGIVFTDLYYVDRDKNNAVSKGLTNPDNPDKYTITQFDVPVISRLNGKWTNEDNVGMFIELGFGGSRSGTNVVLRHGYGWWNASPTFQLLAGHTTSPFSQLNPSQLLGTQQGIIIGNGYGDWYSGRFVQVRGTYKFGQTARLEVALIDPNGGDQGPWTTYQENSKIPRIDIGVPLHFGPVRIYPAILWQEKNVDQSIPNGVDDKIRVFAGSLGTKMGFGPFGVALEGNWGKNMGNTYMGMGGSPSGKGSITQATIVNNTIHDSETYSWWGDIYYKFGPVTPHFIFGQQTSMNKTSKDQDIDVRTQMIGVSVPIQLAKGFSLRPELMWYDDGKTKVAGSNTNNGKFAMYGVQFQVTF